MLEVIKSS